MKRLYLYHKNSMAKYRNSLVCVICQLLEQNLTIRETCRLMDITRKTFYQWYKDKPAFRQDVDNAYVSRDLNILRALSQDKIIVEVQKVQY